MARGKILTVDDEADFVALIKNYFSLRGYEVFTALRGVTALEIVKKEMPDLIFIDLKLPGIDGEQILQRVKEIHPKAKVIMVTAFKDEGQAKEKVLKAGAYAFFEKPIESFKELQKVVDDAIGG